MFTVPAGLLRKKSTATPYIVPGSGGVSQGTGASNPEAVPLPDDRQANDILVLLVYSDGTSISAPSGWTKLGTTYASGGVGVPGCVGLSVFCRVWDRVSSTVSVNYGASVISFPFVWLVRGGSSFPVTAGGGQGTITTTASVDGHDPDVANTLNIGILLTGEEDAVYRIATWTNTGLSDITNHSVGAAATTGGSGYGFQLAFCSGKKAAAGPLGLWNFGMSNGTRREAALFSFYIRP